MTAAAAWPIGDHKVDVDTEDVGPDVATGDTGISAFMENDRKNSDDRQPCPQPLTAWTPTILIVLFGIYGQKIRRDTLITLATVSAALLSVWVVATQIAKHQGCYALVGCVGIAGRVAFALQ